MSTTELKQQIKNSVITVDPTAQVILFGSRARGDERINSDWDILVLSKNEKIEKQYETEIRHKLFELQLYSGEAISTFVYSNNEWNGKYAATPFFENIKKEGVVL